MATLSPGVASLVTSAFTPQVRVGVTALITVTTLSLLAYRLARAYGEGSARPRSVVREAGDVQEGEEKSPDSPDPEPATVEPAQLMTDENWVIQILASKGGQAWQTTIVNETEWSKSKVSRLLAKMEENGMIEKHSDGRENIIVLAGQSSVEEHVEP